MRRKKINMLQMLNRLLDAQTEGARAKIFVAQTEAMKRKKAASEARRRHEVLLDRADSYLSEHIDKMQQLQNGGSIYSALSHAAVLHNHEASRAKLRSQNCAALVQASAEAVKATLDRYLQVRASAGALSNRCAELERVEICKASKREDDAVAENCSVFSAIRHV